MHIQAARHHVAQLPVYRPDVEPLDFRPLRPLGLKEARIGPLHSRWLSAGGGGGGGGVLDDKRAEGGEDWSITVLPRGKGVFGNLRHPIRQKDGVVANRIGADWFQQVSMATDTLGGRAGSRLPYILLCL
jgi:hypothetical protein